MAQIVINESIPPYQVSVGESAISLRTFFEKAKTQATAEGYQYEAELKVLVDDCIAGRRTAQVNSFNTRLGAEGQVTESSQIATQGKGDQGNY